MFLILIVCLMKIMEMTSNRFRRCGEKENRALNGHIRNCFPSKNGTKFCRGMTEHPHQNSEIPQFYPQHHYHHQPIKRPLTSPNNTIQYNFQNANFDTSPTAEGGGFTNNKVTQQYDELTESNLRKNAQIVLNNLNRHALKTYLYEKLNNNNPNLANRIMSSPESDCNSNPHIGGLPLGCSIASSQDFTHDNSDYQWFLDYGYRDGVTHNSILSSLSASYNGIGELSYYEDLAKNIDANLAEVDIESFRAEDINSLLAYRKEDTKTRTHHETDLDNSICKSKQLFSPVKESVLSVDSLDLDCYADDPDIILTCQANKDNYTIAFEGSVVYSDESYYDGHHDIYSKMKQNSINSNVIDDIVKRKALEVSMSRSDTGFTTWSKLKKVSTSQLQRYPSGNNNNTSINITRHTPHCFVRKSSSLPNLQINSNNQLHVSQAISTSTVDSYGKMRTLLPMCPIPVQSSISESESPAPLQNSSSSNEPQPNPPSFNLVKLFIKQKSSSTDTCMDVSSGCWPSDSNSSVDQRQRKKSMNDSGKGSALSRHDEDNENDFQYDSLDVPTNSTSDNVSNHHKQSTTTGTSARSNDLYRDVFDSPSHRNNYKECNLNIRNYPKHLTNVINNNNNNNNNNSFEKDSLKETNRSLSDTSRTSDNITQLYTTARRPPSLETITRSIQTSFLVQPPLPIESLTSIKVVTPSFLAQLNLGNKMNTGTAMNHQSSASSGAASAPVYVVYPNYALPDLAFVNTHQSDIILSPISYKDVMPATRKQRPMSLATDASELTSKDYKHVIDWKSLIPLLPIEYRKMLKHIPEVNTFSIDATLSQRPMFCMSPPLRRNRPLSCDCSSICTLSSGSSQPPSSGFRGSSTLLTDSEFETATVKDPLQNMYVYQYENTRMENEILSSAAERPPSGRTSTTTAAAVPAPRGILRRNSNSGKIGKSKRNSMFDEDTAAAPHVVDKRRSLQEQYYTSADTHSNIIEDYLAEMSEHHHHHHHRDNKSQKRLTNSRVTSHRQYYTDAQDTNELNSIKSNKTNLNYIMELNEEANRRLGFGRKETDIEAARIRAENFLSNVPKSDLKYYAEIANILESIENCTEAYDRKKLRNEVSRALSQQKRVSFIHNNKPPSITTATTVYNENLTNGAQLLTATNLGCGKEFKTPPNSPNISIAALRLEQKNKKSEAERLEKIQSNRFKRLQIQWELLSKEGAALEKELMVKETRSGGSTPTSANGGATLKSKIPRPVSYPATKHTAPSATSKALQSPSRMAMPKKYTVTTTSPTVAGTANTTATSRPRTPSKPHNTPKKSVPVQSRISSRCTR